MNDSTRPLAATLALASATGARSMVGLAALSRALGPVAADGAPAGAAGLQVAGGPHPVPVLGTSSASAISALCAAGELFADKLPGIPDRISAIPLLGRVGAGAVIGAAVGATSGRDRATGALLGAGAAYLAAEISFRLRRELSRHVPSLAAALIEDAAIYWLAAAGARLLATPATPEAG